MKNNNVYQIKPKVIFKHPFNKYDLDKPTTRETQNEEITDYFNYGFNQDTMNIYAKLVKRTIQTIDPRDPRLRDYNPNPYNYKNSTQEESNAMKIEEVMLDQENLMVQQKPQKQKNFFRGLMRLNDQIPMDFGGFGRFFDPTILNTEGCFKDEDQNLQTEQKKLQQVESPIKKKKIKGTGFDEIIKSENQFEKMQNEENPVKEEDQSSADQEQDDKFFGREKLFEYFLYLLTWKKIKHDEYPLRAFIYKMFPPKPAQTQQEKQAQQQDEADNDALFRIVQRISVNLEKNYESMLEKLRRMKQIGQKKAQASVFSSQKGPFKRGQQKFRGGSSYPGSKYKNDDRQASSKQQGEYPKHSSRFSQGQGSSKFKKYGSSEAAKFVKSDKDKNQEARHRVKKQDSSDSSESSSDSSSSSSDSGSDSSNNRKDSKSKGKNKSKHRGDKEKDKERHQKHKDRKSHRSKHHKQKRIKKKRSKRDRSVSKRDKHESRKSHRH